MKLSKHFLLLLIVLFTVPAGDAWAGIADRVVRARIAGIDVIAYRTGVKDVVTVMGTMPAGDAFAGENAAVPTLASMMLDRGTTRRDKFEIARLLEEVGAGILFGSSPQLLTLNAWSLSKDVPLLIELLAEQLRHPAFLPEEFEKVRIEATGRAQRALENTDYLADEALAQVVFPAGHPNHPRGAERFLADAQRATLEEIRRFHARHYGPAHLKLVFVGDLDIELIHRELEKAFGGWSGGVDVIRTDASSQPAAREMAIAVPGKSSVSVSLGQATGLRYTDPDTQALRVATAILGDGFTGRLMKVVRDQEGLTYRIRATTAEDTFNGGIWKINASFAPELLERGIASIRRELLEWWQNGVTEQELEARKTNVIGAYRVRLSDTRGMAEALMMAALHGYPMSWMDEYPKVIESLTLEQVNAAIRKYIDPDSMVLVTVGSHVDASSGTR